MKYYFFKLCFVGMDYYTSISNEQIILKKLYIYIYASTKGKYLKLITTQSKQTYP